MTTMFKVGDKVKRDLHDGYWSVFCIRYDKDPFGVYTISQVEPKFQLEEFLDTAKYHNCISEHFSIVKLKKRVFK